jgi:hypothetical protein
MKKYSIIILSILVAIAAAVFAVSQILVSDGAGEEGFSVGNPYTNGPTTEPYAAPPTSPPPTN